MGLEQKLSAYWVHCPNTDYPTLLHSLISVLTKEGLAHRDLRFAECACYFVGVVILAAKM